MTARDLATIVLRVFALYLLVQAASAIPALAATIIEMGHSVREGRSLLGPAVDWPQSLLTFGTVWSVVVLTAVGFGFLRWAPRLAARLVPATRDARAGRGGGRMTNRWGQVFPFSTPLGPVCRTAPANSVRTELAQGPLPAVTAGATAPDSWPSLEARATLLPRREEPPRSSAAQGALAPTGADERG